MKKFKHVKYKNTGIIFELLCKQVTSDVLSNKTNTSLNIIKKFFRKNTELYKDLQCYQTLIESRNISPNSASKLVDAILKEHDTVNIKKLNKEKYNLIGEIKENYPIDQFFESRIPNYKLLASVYKLFEYQTSDNPVEHVSCYDTILEHISLKKTSKELISEDSDNIWDMQSSEIKELASSMLIKKFNKKYAILNENQKQLVNKYVSENTELPAFKNFVYSETTNIQNKLTKLQNRCTDNALKIKLTEAIKLSHGIVRSKKITDEHISSLVKFYELIDLLEKGKV